MFRPLFFLLIFANLAFYAWTQGYLGPLQTGREPQRLNEQIVPDKLRVVVVPAAGAAPAGGAAPVASVPAVAPVAAIPVSSAPVTAVLTASAAAPTEPAAPTAPAAPTPPTAAVVACRLVSGLARADVEAFTAALAGASVEAKPVEESSSYWVHIPSQGSAAAADKKAGELRQLGVKDFHIIKDAGANQFALSLGLFKSEAAATEYLVGLGKRGVKSARIEVRDHARQLPRVFVRGPAVLLDKKLPEWLAGRSGITAAPCPP